jgi:hypothetical protein
VGGYNPHGSLRDHSVGGGGWIQKYLEAMEHRFRQLYNVLWEHENKTDYTTVGVNRTVTDTKSDKKHMSTK